MRVMDATEQDAPLDRIDLRPGEERQPGGAGPDAEVSTAEAMAAASPAGGRREWIGRAVFEAGLIVLGLVGALLVDDWRDTRARTQRVEAALASIRAELDANHAALAEVIARHETLMVTLRELATAGRHYDGPILRPATISAVAWDAARDAAQSAYLTELSLFNNQLYSGDVAATFRRQPRSLEGRLNDLTGRARSLQRRYAEALQSLR
jgi:type II secretory pathway pseudopilin PulG